MREAIGLHKVLWSQLDMQTTAQAQNGGE